jgi:hypothetical protein
MLAIRARESQSHRCSLSVALRPTPTDILFSFTSFIRYYTYNQSLSTGQYAGVSCPSDSWWVLIIIAIFPLFSSCARFGNCNCAVYDNHYSGPQSFVTRALSHTPFRYPYLGKYHIACVGGDINNEAPKCLNAVGIIFTYAITYTGFLLLAIGTLWNANIVKKLREIRGQWRALRGSRPVRR